jgi:hypothetical protein
MKAGQRYARNALTMEVLREYNYPRAMHLFLNCKVFHRGARISILGYLQHKGASGQDSVSWKCGSWQPYSNLEWLR